MIFYSDMDKVVVGDIVVEIFSNSSNFDMICIVENIENNKVSLTGLFNESPIEIKTDCVRGKNFLSGWEKFGRIEQYNIQVENFDFCIPLNLDEQVLPKIVEHWKK